MTLHESIGTAGDAEAARSADSQADRMTRRERAAADAIRTAVRDLHDARHGPVVAGAPALDLTLRLRVRPADNWAVEFAPALAEQVADQMAGLHAALGAYREGAVYCFKCESTVCEHAVPPSPLSVFAGYEPIGRPEWRDLGQVLLSRRDERLPNLYDTPAHAVAAVIEGHDLRQRQLAEFGRSSLTYSILGQVAAGYFRAGGSGNVDRFAVTFQAVECRGVGGRIEVKLNAIGLLPDGTPLEEWLASEAGAGLARARAAARRAIAQVELLAAGAAAGGGAAALRHVFGRVPGILRRLAESIERADRQGQRRTRHAEQRRREQRRPVDKALDDAGAAPPEAFLFDEKTGARIVCGPQGRIHVFNPEGRHVTSFTLPAGGVEFRMRTARWARLPEDQVESVRSAIRGATP